MALKSERISQNVTGDYQPGISHTSDGEFPEVGTGFPWQIDPEISWLEYQCWCEYEVDSGIVIHRPLPQSDLGGHGNPRIPNADTLASVGVHDKNYNTLTKGPNLKSIDDFEDVAQRMASTSYRVCLKGWAVRVGYQIPIPRIVTIGGVPAVPDDERPQKVRGPILAANHSGVPVYFCSWESWYTVLQPPKRPDVPPANLAEHIRADAELPKAIQVPISLPDEHSTRESPPNSQANVPRITPTVRGQ